MDAETVFTLTSRLLKYLRDSRAMSHAVLCIVLQNIAIDMLPTLRGSKLVMLKACSSTSLLQHRYSSSTPQLLVLVCTKI